MKRTCFPYSDKTDSGTTCIKPQEVSVTRRFTRLVDLLKNKLKNKKKIFHLLM